MWFKHLRRLTVTIQMEAVDANHLAILFCGCLFLDKRLELKFGDFCSVWIFCRFDIFKKYHIVRLVSLSPSTHESMVTTDLKIAA